MVGASRHARMHAIDASFGDCWGCAVAYANPLGHCMLLPEGDALPERIKRKASADDALLGGMEPGMHAGWIGEGRWERLPIADCLTGLSTHGPFQSEFWRFGRPVLKGF